MANALCPGNVQRQRFSLAQLQVQMLVCISRTVHSVEARKVGELCSFCRRKRIGPHDADVAFRTLKMGSSLGLYKPRIALYVSCHTILYRQMNATSRPIIACTANRSQRPSADGRERPLPSCPFVGMLSEAALPRLPCEELPNQRRSIGCHRRRAQQSRTAIIWLRKSVASAVYGKQFHLRLRLPVPKHLFCGDSIGHYGLVLHGSVGELVEVRKVLS